MKKTTEERLEELLEKKDQELEKMGTQLYKAQEAAKTTQYQLDQARGGWGVPQEMKEEEDDERMALPRLEIRWYQRFVMQVARGDWSNYHVVYSLVTRAYQGHLVRMPMGQVTTSGLGRGIKPWEDLRVNLPIRMQYDMIYDAVHLKLPAYAVTPEGDITRIDNLSFTIDPRQDKAFTHAKSKGREARRLDTLEIEDQG